MLSLRARPAPPAGFIPPCLPSPADRPPSGPGWLHEIKHDGFRMMVGRDPAGVRLLTRNGNDWTDRYPLIAEAARALQVRSFLMDGEAVACDGGVRRGRAELDAAIRAMLDPIRPQAAHVHDELMLPWSLRRERGASGSRPRPDALRRVPMSWCR